MNEASGESSRGPLGMMDQHEKRGGQESGIITDMHRDLGIAFGQSSPLVDKIKQYTFPLRPMTRLGYGDKPTLGIRVQGRGFYPEPNIYIKGIGSPMLLGEERGEGDIPGFPTQNSKDILFDQAQSPASEPRVIGTLALKHAIDEYVTGLVVAAYTPGIESVEDLIRKKVTIPIGVTSFPQLTQRQQEIIRGRIAQLSDDDPQQKQEKESLLKQSNLHPLGSIGICVPGDERIGQFEDGSNNDSQADSSEKDAMRKAADPEITARMGEKLREVIEIGFVYPHETAHGQNFYVAGAPADLVDVLSLGDCKDATQRELLIYKQLSRNAGLMPLAFPRNLVEVGFEAVTQAQTAFWEKFLHGIASPEAIRKIPQLMPAMREQILLATARLLVQKSNSQVWEETAAKRRELLNHYNEYGTIAELEEDLSSQLTDEKVSAYQKMTAVNDPLGINPMSKFLETGDESYLRDSQLSTLTALSDTLDSIADSKDKNRLLEALGNLQVARYIRVLSGEYDPDLDPLADEHFLFITNHLKAGFIERAERIIHMLGRVVQMPSTEIDRSKEKPSKVYYARAFLGRGLDEQGLRREFNAESKRRYADWESQHST